MVSVSALLKPPIYHESLVNISSLVKVKRALVCSRRHGLLVVLNERIFVSISRLNEYYF